MQAFDATVYSVTERTSSYAPACPKPCAVDPCGKPSYRCCERRSTAYGGIMLQAYPGLGWGVEFGQWFCRTKCADLAWELNMNYQDLTDDFNNISTGQSGKWMGARLGVKASFFPKKLLASGGPRRSRLEHRHRRHRTTLRRRGHPRDAAAR